MVQFFVYVIKNTIYATEEDLNIKSFLGSSIQMDLPTNKMILSDVKITILK